MVENVRRIVRTYLPCYLIDVKEVRLCLLTRQQSAVGIVVRCRDGHCIVVVSADLDARAAMCGKPTTCPCLWWVPLDLVGVTLITPSQPDTND